jgi:histidine ammonia-lyase
VERAHAIIRAHVAKSSGDRPPSPDIIRLGALMASGAFDALTESVAL